jgi:phage gpG-like protein
MISVKIDNEHLKTMVADIAERCANPNQAMKEVSILMMKDVQEHFKKEEGSEGKWAKLAPSTVAWKYKNKYAPPVKTLVNTGQLLRRNIPEHGRDYAKVFNDMSYAVYHEQPNGGGGKIPKRDFMWISNKARDLIVKVMANYIMRKAY